MSMLSWYRLFCVKRTRNDLDFKSARVILLNDFSIWTQQHSCSPAIDIQCSMFYLYNCWNVQPSLSGMVLVCLQFFRCDIPASGALGSLLPLPGDLGAIIPFSWFQCFMTSRMLLAHCKHILHHDVSAAGLQLI